MMSFLIPAAISLITSLAGRGGGNSQQPGTGGTGGTTGEQIDPLLASLLPQYGEMFQMEAAKQKASLPLYNAVLNQAFGGLPSWARDGVPGVQQLGVTPDMLQQLTGAQGLGQAQPRTPNSRG